MNESALRVLVICPVAPPQVGGVADHLAQWIQAVGALSGPNGPRVQLGLLSSPGASREALSPAELLEPHLEWGLGAWEGVAQKARDWNAQVVLLHHVPHLYDRWGLPWGPTRALAPGGPLGAWPTVVMAHELHYAWNEGWRGLSLGLVQRILLRPMLQGATRVVVSVECRRQALIKAQASLAARLHCLPVGASLPPPPKWSREHAREHLQLPQDVFLLAGLGLAHPSKALAPVALALDGLKQAGIKAMAAMAGELSLEHPQAKALGRLNPLDASALLLAADLVTLPYADGASHRRTTLMNAWQAGSCVLTQWGVQSDRQAIPEGSLAHSPAGQAEAFAQEALRLAQAPEERQALASAGQRHFEEHLSWPQLAIAWLALLEEAHATFSAWHQGITSG